MSPAKTLALTLTRRCFFQALSYSQFVGQIQR